MTFVRPEYRQNKHAVKRIVDGVEFLSWKVGIMSSARISADGRIYVSETHTRVTYRARIELPGGHHVGIMNAAGDEKRFRTEHGAMKAAIKELARVERRRG